MTCWFVVSMQLSVVFAGGLTCTCKSQYAPASRLQAGVDASSADPGSSKHALIGGS